MTFLAYVFPEITAPKNTLRYMSRKLCFRGPLERKRSKCMETLFQSEWQHL